MLYDLLRSGQFSECGEKLGPSVPRELKQVRALLGNMVMDWHNRVLIGPVVKRMLRCNDDDVKELRHVSQIIKAWRGFSGDFARHDLPGKVEAVRNSLPAGSNPASTPPAPT